MSGPDAQMPPIQGPLLKVGAVLGAVWLAFPQLEKIPLWLAGAIVGSLLMAAIFKKVAILLIPLAILIWLVRPRPKRTHNTQ